MSTTHRTPVAKYTYLFVSTYFIGNVGPVSLLEELCHLYVPHPLVVGDELCTLCHECREVRGLGIGTGLTTTGCHGIQPSLETEVTFIQFIAVAALPFHDP